MPGVFGMGNLRIAYLHNLLRDWLGDAGDIAEFALRVPRPQPEGRHPHLHGHRHRRAARRRPALVDLELGVQNQDDVETTPGTATRRALRRRSRRMPAEPAPTAAVGRGGRPGTFLEQDTIDKIGRTLPPVAAPPVGANDIARWAIATYWPEPPPPSTSTPRRRATPWGGIVAPRDFDPFAWMPNRPWAGDWLWGMGAEPGKRVLNGGQRNRYFAPDPPRRRHLRDPPLRRRRSSARRSAAPWCSSRASSAGPTSTASSSASASRRPSTTERGVPRPQVRGTGAPNRCRRAPNLLRRVRRPRRRTRW